MLYENGVPLRISRIRSSGQLTIRTASIDLVCYPATPAKSPFTFQLLRYFIMEDVIYFPLFVESSDPHSVTY